MGKVRALRVQCPVEEGGASREVAWHGVGIWRDSPRGLREETGLRWMDSATNLKFP